MRQINKKHLNTNKQYENEINENTQEEELMGVASLVLGIISLVTWILGNVTRIPRHELPQTLDFSDFLPLFT